jgi:hypothetical protein
MQCDAMYRTINRERRIEKAPKSLFDLGPILQLLVLASLDLVLLLFNKEIKQELKIVALGTSDDYVRVSNMKPCM